MTPGSPVPQAPPRRERRRGAELEQAILDAAWEQLTVAGYAGFTFEAVADRARTSRPVLYRRWPTREDLLRATVHSRVAAQPMPVPDTGSLRTDLIALMHAMNRNRIGMVALIGTQLGAFYDNIGLTPAELRAQFIGKGPSSVGVILERAVARGEADPLRLTSRVRDVPLDLFRHDALMTLAPVSDEAIVAIIDEVFLPLVRPAPGPAPG